MRLLTVREVADVARLHPESVRMKARQGQIKATKTGKGSTCPYRFTPRAVADFLGIPVEDLPLP